MAQWTSITTREIKTRAFLGPLPDVLWKGWDHDTPDARRQSCSARKCTHSTLRSPNPPRTFWRALFLINTYRLGENTSSLLRHVLPAHSNSNNGEHMLGVNLQAEPCLFSSFSIPPYRTLQDSYFWDANHPVSVPPMGGTQKSCCMLTGIVPVSKPWERSLQWSICECAHGPSTWRCHSRHVRETLGWPLHGNMTIHLQQPAHSVPPQMCIAV